MIKVENLNKYFNRFKKSEIHVINNTSFELPSNGLVAILGESGCGKTTLLNVLGGLDNVNSGNIYIDGNKITKRRVGKIDKIRNLNVGYIFQDYKLVDGMTVFDNVALSLKIIGIKDKKEIENRVLYTLEKVNMLRFKNRPVNMLSGGERQRVGIARALVKNPKIIIADEPTGNLDSKNSLEIMNIIKSISNKYLVVLVTHEVDLAKFYADRIIELEDGVVIKDYKNKHEGALNYKIDNQIYLKDFKDNIKIDKDNIKLNVYRDNDEKIDFTLVFKNGNVYIKSNTKEKLEIIENNSNIELINDHYKEINEVNLDENTFDIESVCSNKYKEKYSSIFNLFSYIKYGFSKVLNYPILKKVLLFGFILSGMFITYAISSIFATLNIKDSDFVTINKDYISVKINNIRVEDYINFETLENINYVLPNDSIVKFETKFDKYLQTRYNSAVFSGSLSDINMIKNEDLIAGRMPENINEVVVDKKLLTNLIKNQMTKMYGFGSYKDYLNHKIKVDYMDDFTIVGITDKEVPNIYTNRDLFINIINGSKRDEIYEENPNDIHLIDYNLYINNKIQLTKGRLPENDYEVMMPEDYYETYYLNKKIDTKVNDTKLTVVGYYKVLTDDYIDDYFVNNNTIKYSLIKQTNKISLYSNDKNGTIDYLKNIKVNANDSYEYSKTLYLADRHDSMISSLVTASIILGVSLIEILLMIRSSFLSRIKEVGIYRAIGVKKSDIYKMFTGEIVAISCTASLIGVAFMTYSLYYLSQIEYLNNYILVNPLTFIISFGIIFIFNLLVGLIPVFNTIRKTPAQILARIDVD